MAKSAPKPTPQLETLQSQIDELTSKYTRAVADYQNLEKRISHQQSQFVHLTTASLISQFLPLFDNLSRASAHLKDPGLNLILDEYAKLLDQLGVTSISPQDGPFDPATMECIEQVPGPSNQVVELVESGYQLDTTLIRPAKVKVGTHPSK